MKMLPFNNCQNGFSLLEVLVALTLLLIGVLSMASLQASAIRQNSFAMRNTQATKLIEDKFEGLKNTPYANILQGTQQDTVTVSGMKFDRQTTVTTNQAYTGTKTIVVTVTWRDPATHTVSFRTIISQPPQG